MIRALPTFFSYSGFIKEYQMYCFVGFYVQIKVAVSLTSPTSGLSTTRQQGLHLMVVLLILRRPSSGELVVTFAAKSRKMI